MSASTISPPRAEMTDYLLELGHRRIGFIKGHPQAYRQRTSANAASAPR